MKRILFITILMSALTACEKTITIDIPQRDPKLVINGWLEKGVPVSVMVGKSRNVLQPQNPTGSNLDNYVVKNAMVVLFENNTAIDTLDYDAGTYRYISTNGTMLRDGFSYTLRAVAPGFAQAEAFTAMPSQSVIDQVTRIKDARTTADGYKQDELQIRITDPTEQNFYLVQIYRPDYGYGQGYPVSCVSTTDKDIEPIGEYADPLSTDNCFDGGTLLMRDVNFNGSQKQLRFFVDSYELQDYIAPNGTVYRPYVKVMRVTEDYFKFLKSYHVYFNSSDNPFAEPANVYSNVKNGYGSFTAYTVATQSL